MAVRLCSVLCVCALSVFSAEPDAPQIAPRDEYHLRLPKIAVNLDNTGFGEKIRITFDGSQDFAIITPLGDQFVAVTKDGRQTTVYPEDPDRAFALSDFEARILARVCKEFTSTLKEFEEQLQKGKWARCRYLDSYFPRFLAGFYHLYTTARNSSTVLPRTAFIHDSLFDISLSSPKTDARVAHWKDNPEHALKLRILSRELIFQIQQWHGKELTFPRRNREIDHGEKFTIAFSLFVRYYFNTMTSTP